MFSLTTFLMWTRRLFRPGTGGPVGPVGPVGTVGHVCACLANAGRRHKSTANNVLQIERNLGSTAALAGPAEFLELANARRQAQPNEKSRSFFRRSLPEPPAIAFAKPEGKRIFSEALSDGTMECFFPLIEQFRTQDEPSFCGLAALTMVLNALAIDPKRTWKGPWRWFHERMLDCCSPVEVIEKKGIVFRQLACLARCNGALVKDMQANETTEAQFREDIMASCTGGKDMGIVLVSYSRKEFLQTGDGHYSPIGGYHRPTDSVLILDVARFKYPPHWVPLHSLWNAMNRIDPDTTKTRGYMVLKKQEDMVSLVFTMSRPRGNCRSSLRNLDHSVTSTVMSAYKTATTDGNVTNNTTLIKSFLTHIPDNLKSMLSTYNTEYNLPITEGPKEYQEAAETLLTDIRRLPLYNLVMDVVRLGLPPAPPPSPAIPGCMTASEWSSAYHTVLLLAVPHSFWTQIADRHIRECIIKLCDTGDSASVNREINHLRLQVTEILTFEAPINSNLNCSNCSHSRQECSHHGQAPTH